ncbi:hypothetical protein POL68_41115 [Stigmatella sp. ncwal1]|uniref:Phosphodiester glycosidase domain-containing protein n=1 Tax=Stigmatella ashevillensis TaxID=2995309 RepID=A0ABT5DMN3_9BACT|nr:hypothetical protein [Stigmatella ashevillena]MDC0714922.1 hypothetical protein [Stigmatella ashevillena]
MRVLLLWVLIPAAVLAQGKEECLQQPGFAAQVQGRGLDDLGALQKLREEYDKRGRCGEELLYQLVERHFQQQEPLLEARLSRTVQLGEDFLAYGARLQDRGAVYQTIGYFILGRVGQKLEKLGDHARHEELIKRLAAQRVHVAVKGENKAAANIRKGNWKYLGKRAWQKVAELLSTVADGLEDSLGPEFFVEYFEAPRVQNARWMLLPRPKVALPADVSVFTLSARGGDSLGSAIWMPRPQLRAHYLAAGNVASTFRQMAGSRHVALFMTGGFTNAQRQPEGLTVDRGTIVNAVLMPDRHGLVIVEENGGIRVINLKRDQIQLPMGPRSTQEIGNPFASLIAYSRLLEWCRTRRATLFQTQLLLYGDELLIDPDKVKHQLRERRLLALVSDRSTGAAHHVVFDITQNVRLDEPAVKLQELLSQRKMKVEALLNLDVGNYNILGVLDARGRPLREPQGPVPVDRATNLLVYTFAR